MKDIYEESLVKIGKLTKALKERMSEEEIMMPGYTHAQKAMPTSTHTWLGSFYDALSDQVIILQSF
jgi:argininosuccinate lyase